MIYVPVFRIMAWRPQHVPPGAHNPVALWAEWPTPSQDSERYLVAFYDKLNAAAG